jgi:uncharacterized protein YkwD
VLRVRPLVPRRVLSWAAAVAAAVVLAVPAESASLTPPESSLLTAMNEVRLAHGLAPLHMDPRLEQAARTHSGKMLRAGSLFHGAFVQRIRRVGVRAPHVGENLAWGAGHLSGARAIVKAWLASPEHRANLLRPGYSAVGIGALRGSFSGYANALMITSDFAGT